MPLPKIDPSSQAKPLAYDPARKKFIYYDEIVSGREKIVPVDALSEADFKKLVVERLRAGPDFRMQAISGPPYGRDQVIAAIERDEPDGRMTLEAEKSYLIEFLAEIQENL
jgi:hypothetical protein